MIIMIISDLVMPLFLRSRLLVTLNERGVLVFIPDYTIARVTLGSETPLSFATN